MSGLKSLGEVWGFEGHQDIYACVEDISSSVLQATRQSSEARKPWESSLQKDEYSAPETFLTTKGRSSYRLERPLASQPCTVIKPGWNMSRCSLFRQCPAIVPWAEELKGRSFRGGVVAQTKWRTVLFDILPKVHNWKKKLRPVRNPGCGGKCFLGWGKRVSRLVSWLGHGWTNTLSLAEKWLWWEIFWMDSYLMIFRITQVLLF